jgi:hypothetical protein
MRSYLGQVLGIFNQFILISSVSGGNVEIYNWTSKALGFITIEQDPLFVGVSPSRSSVDLTDVVLEGRKSHHLRGVQFSPARLLGDLRRDLSHTHPPGGGPIGNKTRSSVPFPISHPIPGCVQPLHGGEPPKRRPFTPLELNESALYLLSDRRDTGNSRFNPYEERAGFFWYDQKPLRSERRLCLYTGWPQWTRDLVGLPQQRLPLQCCDCGRVERGKIPHPEHGAEGPRAPLQLTRNIERSQRRFGLGLRRGYG